MLTEKRMQKVLDKVIRNIQVDTDILDVTGMIVASSIKERIGKNEPFVKSYVDKEGKNTFVYNGRTYMRFIVDKSLTYFIAMEGTSKAVRNYCLLAVSLLEIYLKVNNYKADREEVIRRFILNQISELEFQEFVREHKIEVEAVRCAFVIRTLGMEADQIHNILSKAFPKSQGDFLILIDSHTVALVKNIPDEMDEDELLQLAAAIEETVLNEASIKTNIGIGKCKENIYQIRGSYEEAVKAIDIGKIYDANGKIYLYDGLLLERFLYEIPTQTSQKFYQNIFHEEFRKTLNDEMIATIEKFFENSLNLSETARQLYIHRNTLVYRLDKIQKVLGLDLRNFHDAVTFKIMMMLERQDREC